MHLSDLNNLSMNIQIKGWNLLVIGCELLVLSEFLAWLFGGWN